MKNNVYVVGAGGHFRSLMNLLDHNSYIIVGVFDETYEEEKPEKINGIPLIGDLTDIQESMVLVLAYGVNDKRKKLYLKYGNQVLKENLIHPTALVEKYTRLDYSNQIFADVYINSNVTIGENNIINSKVLLEHEVVIGSHTHISIGSVIGGRSVIGDNCFIGAGAVIIDKVSICDDVTIGANSAVIRNITQAGVYVGNPAKKIK